MADFDDPFDRDTQSREGWRLQHKVRKNIVPLETIHNRIHVGDVNTYTGYSGDVQATLTRDTLWPQYQRAFSRHAKQGRNASNDRIHRGMKNQDLGSSFFTKRLRLVDGPNPVSFHGHYPKRNPTVEESLVGYRWPCSQAYSKSRMDWDNAFNAINTRYYSELIAWGAMGIARTLPTVPPSSAVVFLGELIRDTPSLPGKTLMKRPTLGGAASEFLNYTFGLQPSVDDIATMYSTAHKAEEILGQYRRDAGRQIRRRATLLDETEISTSTHRQAEYPFGNRRIDPLGNQINTCTHTVSRRKRVWFSGAYTYRIPNLESRLGKLMEFNRLYGVVPTAKDVWDLTPWSWLVDWSVNTGSLFKNLSTLSRDGIRIHHAYVMMQVDTEYKYSVPGNTVTFVETSKNRIRASPFGFGFRPGSLSNKQKAILTALGISRWS